MPFIRIAYLISYPVAADPVAYLLWLQKPTHNALLSASIVNGHQRESEAEHEERSWYPMGLAKEVQRKRRYRDLGYDRSLQFVISNYYVERSEVLLTDTDIIVHSSSIVRLKLEVDLSSTRARTCACRFQIVELPNAKSIAP